MSGQPKVSDEAWGRLLQAARDLLEARANQMQTALEWEALRQALIECNPSAARDGLETEADQ